MKIDHPSRASKIKARNINRDIRFAGLLGGDLKDYYQCFHWEYLRTKYFLSRPFAMEVNAGRKKLLSLHSKLDKLKSAKRKAELIKEWENRNPDNLQWEEYYPYYIKSWPEKPYLSHSYATRKKWRRCGSIGRSLLDNPLRENFPMVPPNPTCEHPTEDPYVVDGYWAHGYARPPASSLTIPLHIGVNWNKEKLVGAIESHAAEILKLVKERKTELEANGEQFEIVERKHPMKTYKSDLKVLGLMRLDTCCGKSWEEMERIYNDKDTSLKGSYFSYQDKDDYYKARRNFEKRFPLS